MLPKQLERQQKANARDQWGEEKKPKWIFRSKMIPPNAKEINQIQNLQLVENKIKISSKQNCHFQKSQTATDTIKSTEPVISTYIPCPCVSAASCYYSGSCATDVEDARGLPSAPHVYSLPDGERKKEERDKKGKRNHRKSVMQNELKDISYYRLTESPASLALPPASPGCSHPS